MLRDVSAPLVFPEEPSSLSTHSSPNSPISNQPDLLPATAAVDCCALDAFLLLVFGRDTNGGRGLCCQVGAVGRRFKAGAGAFLYTTEQKRGAGTGQLEQNKAVALLGPEISNGGQHTVGVVVGL